MQWVCFKGDIDKKIYILQSFEQKALQFVILKAMKIGIQTKSFIVTNESLGKNIFEGVIMLDVKSWFCKLWFAVLPNLCDAVHMV